MAFWTSSRNSPAQPSPASVARRRSTGSAGTRFRSDWEKQNNEANPKRFECRSGCANGDPDGKASLLCLDLGTSTGFALRTGDGGIVSGTVSFKPSRYDGGGIRYLRFRAWLDSMAQDAAAIGVVHYEEIRRHLSTDAAHVYGGLLATLTSWCEQRSIAYQGAPVGTIKRFIAGKGNADKAAIIAAVRERGFRPVDDNEADALAILLWAIETDGGVR